MKGRKKDCSKGGMPSEREIFGMCGPLHLSSVDWRLPDHRRSVAASLVQGVYILERDRQKNRHGPKALAPIWGQFFHFKCIQLLIDEADSSIFGVVFEHKPPMLNYCYPNGPIPIPPRYVIAFRGTVFKPDTRKRDIKLDIQLALNGLTRTRRYRTALETVQNWVSRVGPGSIWLVGHSLGAAIALHAGRDMAKVGCYIESYLFNPSFTSAPIAKIQDPILRTGIRFLKSFVTVGLALAIKGSGGSKPSQQCDLFTILSPWIPYLFVNPADPICCEYIGYFKHIERMNVLGAGEFGKIAARNSILSLISSQFGTEGEAAHLIPSAYLTKNLSVAEDFKRAHGIHQWWQPHPYWQSELYRLS